MFGSTPVSRRLSASVPGSSTGRCGSHATCGHQFSSPTTGRPSTVTVPSLGSASPSSASRAVDLPAPFAPVKTVILPGLQIASSPCGAQPSRPGTETPWKTISRFATRSGPAVSVEARREETSFAPSRARRTPCRLPPSRPRRRGTCCRRCAAEVGLGREDQRDDAGLEGHGSVDEAHADAHGDEGDGQRREEFEDRAGQERHAQGRHRRRAVLVAEFAHAIGGSLLATEGAERGKTREQVEQLRRQCRHRAQVRSALPLVSRPMRIMKIGISGRVITTMIAEVRSCRAITTIVTGVRITASSSAGR